MKIPRSARLAGEYQKAISEVLAGSFKNHFPEAQGLISVTQADVASDLKNAKIYVSIYAKSPEQQLKTFELIKTNASFIRHALAGMMASRTVPALQFVLDNSMAYGTHIDELIKQLHKDEQE